MMAHDQTMAHDHMSSSACATAVIHVVDDDESFGEAVARLLCARGYAVRTYVNAGDFLLSESGDVPGCILLDLEMPGPNGLDLQIALVKRGSPLPIIFVSGQGDIPTTVKALKAGAEDFLTKPVTSDVLLSAVASALARGKRQRAAAAQLKNWRARYETLTARERAVLDRVVAGSMNKQIAQELGAAERTIKAHRANIMTKMHVQSLAELVHVADRLRDSTTR